MGLTEEVSPFLFVKLINFGIMKTFTNFVRILSIVYCLVFMYRIIFLQVDILEVNMFGMAALFLVLLIIDQLKDAKLSRKEN